MSSFTKITEGHNVDSVFLLLIIFKKLMGIIKNLFLT